MRNTTTHAQAAFDTLFQLAGSLHYQFLVRMPNWSTYTSKNGTGSLMPFHVFHRSTIPLFHSTVPRSIESRHPSLTLHVTDLEVFRGVRSTCAKGCNVLLWSCLGSCSKLNKLWQGITMYHIYIMPIIFPMAIRARNSLIYISNKILHLSSTLKCIMHLVLCDSKGI